MLNSGSGPEGVPADAAQPGLTVAATGSWTPPHIFLITCHDLGRYLRCYGIEALDTPNIDGLAAGGARFSRAFSTASGCSPARAALATGRYPHSAGVMGLAHRPFNWDLPLDQHHVAQMLGAAGYETHLFGLQHVSLDDDRLGFDRVHPFEEKAYSRTVSEQVASYLRKPRRDGPLYVEINLEEVHRPYRELITPDQSLAGIRVPAYLPDDSHSRQELASLQADVHEADAGVGRILAALGDAGIREDCIVIFTTDHGIAMPRAKCTLYDPGIEIALLVQWRNGGIPGGQAIDELVSNIDILPTLLDAAGVTVPDDVQGRSFLSRLRGQTHTARTAIFAEKTFHSYYDPMRAIRTDRYKYIRNFETAFAVEVPGDVQLGSIFRAHVERYHGSEHPIVELYDLDADPWEQRNVAGESLYAEIERELDGSLWTWMEETGDPLLMGPVVSPSYRRARERET